MRGKLWKHTFSRLGQMVLGSPATLSYWVCKNKFCLSTSSLINWKKEGNENPHFCIKIMPFRSVCSISQVVHAHAPMSQGFLPQRPLESSAFGACVWLCVRVYVCTNAHMGPWLLPPPAKVLRITYQRHCTSWYIRDCSFSSTNWRPLTSPPLTSLGSIPWKSVPFRFAQLTPPSVWNWNPWVSTMGLCGRGKLRPWGITWRMVRRGGVHEIIG